MNGQLCSLKFLTLLLVIFMFTFWHLFDYKRKKMITKWIEDSVKLEESKNSFKHPLAPPYPFPYKFLINQPDKCKNRKPFLVLMVLVQCQDLMSRRIIRETWGNESIYDVEVVRIFLVGLPQVAVDRNQYLLKEESVTFGDIVQQDFMDTYHNLTLKTLMGMEWVSKFCPSASYVMKIDSDMFLNADYLIHNILYPDLPIQTNYFTGDLYQYSGPYRTTSSKWYIPKEVYPINFFPPYCSGPGYVFSADMARKIYNVAQVLRVISLEDVFVGICLFRLHIPPRKSPRGVFNTNKLHYDHCKFRKVVTVHHYGGEELQKIWTDFWDKKSQKC